MKLMLATVYLLLTGVASAESSDAHFFYWKVAVTETPLKPNSKEKKTVYEDINLQKGFTAENLEWSCTVKKPTSDRNKLSTGHVMLRENVFVVCFNKKHKPVTSYSHDGCHKILGDSMLSRLIYDGKASVSVIGKEGSFSVTASCAEESWKNRSAVK